MTSPRGARSHQPARGSLPNCKVSTISPLAIFALHLAQHGRCQSDVTERIDQRREFSRQLRRFAMSATEDNASLRARHRHGQRHFVVGGTCQPAHFFEAFLVDGTADAERARTEHRAGRDAHRFAVRAVGRQSFGNTAGPLPTERAALISRKVNHRSSTHVPGERVQEIARCLQMLGYQGSVLLRRVRVSLLERRGQTPMQLLPVRISVVIGRPRFGSTDGGTHIGTRGEHDLINISARISAPRSAVVRTAANAPHRTAIR